MSMSVQSISFSGSLLSKGSWEQYFLSSCLLIAVCLQSILESKFGCINNIWLLFSFLECLKHVTPLSPAIKHCCLFFLKWLSPFTWEPRIYFWECFSIGHLDLFLGYMVFLFSMWFQILFLILEKLLFLLFLPIAWFSSLWTLFVYVILYIYSYLLFFYLSSISATLFLSFFDPFAHLFECLPFHFLHLYLKAFSAVFINSCSFQFHIYFLHEFLLYFLFFLSSIALY